MRYPRFNGPTRLLCASLLFSALLASPLPPAAMGAPSGDRASKVVARNEGSEAEIRIDSARNFVTAHIGSPRGEGQKAIEITFYDKDHQALTFELKALSTPAGSPAAYGGRLDPAALSRTQSLAWTQQSFVGIELRIPLSKGKAEVLKWKKPD
jgi:hypothetical protein